MRILLSAFEPFGGAARNASADVLRLLLDRERGVELRAVFLPTAFDAAAGRLLVEVERVRPAAVICLGEARGRSKLSMERVAVNLDDARIPDNQGFQPLDRAIRTHGPAAYFSTLPVRAMRDAAEAAGVPAELSYTAGTFVCNHVMYALLDGLAQRAAEERSDVDSPEVSDNGRTGCAAWASRCLGGFIHIPVCREGEEKRGVPDLAACCRGLEAAISCLQ